MTLSQLQTPCAPAFSDELKDLYEPFSVRPLRNARVAWLNKRWFLKAGIDCAITAQRVAVEEWLVKRFGVSVPSADDPPEQYLPDEQLLYADRYGASSGSASGGSGRVGTWGLFNAKGIGRTPLVSARSDWYHSHGCMFLEEAVREAIVSEVCVASFPNGAIPTIAVIDAGARLRWRDGTYGERRAIIIRPAFLRLAHLMRSIYFGSAGYPGADQVIDAASVRAMWQRVSVDDLYNSFGNIGVQYGFGHALRLWPGPFFASNFAIDGSLVDFGAFRALPNWFRATGVWGHNFGGEDRLVMAAAQSLARNAVCSGFSVNVDDLARRFSQGFDTGFETALAESGIEDGSNLASQVRKVRARQQARVSDCTGGASEGVEIGGLRPWSRLFRETLLAEAQEMISSLAEGPGSDLSPIAQFVDNSIARADPRPPSGR